MSLAVPSLGAAQQFYTAVLGWTWRPTGPGEGFRTALFGGAPVAGVGALANSLRGAVAWTPFFAVADADATAAHIRERGGTVGVGPLPFGTGRRAGLATDPDGAVFGFWTGEALPGWPSGPEGPSGPSGPEGAEGPLTPGGSGEGAPARLELRTRDAFAAALFYGELFGWASPESTCSVEYANDEVIVCEEGRKLAVIHGGAVEQAPDPRVRPRWYVHFRVPDVTAAVAAARAAGGTVALPPDASPTGGQAILCDPDGGLFTVTAA
ncbi:bleomycin resistance protein [Streptomyces antioxidans]|uniref:Bleomycin resistance protein n=1 Tax=Streptomyces antioxidans TaxID=1507734 RepID=A0A1V4CVS8_9ACTN|nr:bleomycin resistance protein [Streptomyces antioxidans]